MDRAPSRPHVSTRSSKAGLPAESTNNEGPLNTERTKRAAGAAGILLALALTASGCSGPFNAGTPQGGASQSAPAAAETTVAATPVATASTSTTGVPASDKYADPIVLDSDRVKAGGTLHVSGGSLKPGITVKVYAAQQETATYNAATGTYSGSGEVIITDAGNVVVDAQGHFDTDLVVPAGTVPQTFNVQLILPDGNGHLLQATVV